jgi:two-component system chemotaxis response regulator CheB
MVLESNSIYVAPGGFQLGLVRQHDQIVVEIVDKAHPSLHRPSIDFAFGSFLKVVNPRRDRISAAILTGMGKDGARALLDLRNAGHHTIAQDENTCVVYGMPRAAVDIGAAVEELPLERIASHLFHAVMRGREKLKEVG